MGSDSGQHFAAEGLEIRSGCQQAGKAVERQVRTSSQRCRQECPVFLTGEADALDAHLGEGRPEVGDRWAVTSEGDGGARVPSSFSFQTPGWRPFTKTVQFSLSFVKQEQIITFPT